MPAGTRRGTRDHPRACGENFLRDGIRPRPKGSPPRVRGKRKRGCMHESRRGITPARAGKTSRNRLRSLPSSDHPRACGENFPEGSLYADDYGSPPRVRGKPRATRLGLPSVRITPARAGKTLRRPARPGQRADHPRACGENGGEEMICPYNGGSPPRVRGKPYARACRAGSSGITPARAGKTAAAEAMGIQSQGSPPRVRGKH